MDIAFIRLDLTQIFEITKKNGNYTHASSGIWTHDLEIKLIQNNRNNARNLTKWAIRTTHILWTQIYI